MITINHHKHFRNQFARRLRIIKSQIVQETIKKHADEHKRLRAKATQ